MAKKVAEKAPAAGFQPGDFVEVVHDNDPTYFGDRGIVFKVDELVHVAITHLGSMEKRSYLPSQLKKL